ncbi:Transmembrane protein [Parasponia andersonii]|uniref:Transmembrane protein n=1 Tax=Parasponia andersonii TaxID=3476 RepID=A0A2P5AWF4_PARAD|nr:Transmembrane protein [Parasponia andersonii]
MSGRTFVVIFFFWALLTIITPTLVHLSESSKSQHLNEEKSEEIKVRRIMAEKHSIRTPTSLANLPAPAPAPAPSVNVPRNRKTYLGKVFSESMKLVVNKTRLGVV